MPRTAAARHEALDEDDLGEETCLDLPAPGKIREWPLRHTRASTIANAEKFGWDLGPEDAPFAEYLHTPKQLSELLGVTTRQLRDLEPRGLPVQGEGKDKRHPWPETLAWWSCWQHHVAGPGRAPQFIGVHESRAYMRQLMHFDVNPHLRPHRAAR